MSDEKPRQYDLLADQHGVVFEAHQHGEDFVANVNAFDRELIHVIEATPLTLAAQEMFEALRKMIGMVKSYQKDVSAEIDDADYSVVELAESIVAKARGAKE